MNSKRPTGINLIVIINTLSAVVTVLFWIFVSISVFGRPMSAGSTEKLIFSSTLGFMIADMIYAVPILIISVSGLIKMKFYGWTAAQLANILWIYSVTVVIIRDLYLGNVSPGSLIFLPFTLFAVWAFFYLWKGRLAFNISLKSEN